MSVREFFANFRRVNCPWPHSAYLNTKGELMMFGSNGQGQLGLGGKAVRATPTALKSSFGGTAPRRPRCSRDSGFRGVLGGQISSCFSAVLALGPFLPPILFDDVTKQPFPCFDWCFQVKQQQCFSQDVFLLGASSSNSIRDIVSDIPPVTPKSGSALCSCFGSEPSCKKNFLKK